ncbi:MAG: 50S ribosomal protein L10 [bacterium]|nr:50S ribosomal protein L10 [bacterium]
MKTKEQKQEIVDRLKKAFTTPAAVFVHFKGLKVGDETAMRNELRNENVSYYVARKTLMRRALDAASLENEHLELEGEVAIAYAGEGVEDPTAPARSVYTFVKKHPDSLAIVGGVYEGRLMDAAAMNEIATIPPVEVLRGMFLNVINSPIQGLAVALGQISEKRA